MTGSSVSADTQRVCPPTHSGREPADTERKIGQSVSRATRLAVAFRGQASSRPADSPECAAVTTAPEVLYARSADGTNLAYEVSGSGPVEMVLMLGGIPIDLAAEEPGLVRLRKQMTRFSRAVWFDARGRGASEGDPREAIDEEVFAADLIAVLDAVGFERPVLVMGGEGGGLAIHFAVIHPERVCALVLVNSCAYYVREDDYPWGTPREFLDGLTDSIDAHWGRSAPVKWLAPSRVADERFRAWLARSQRLDFGPDQVATATSCWAPVGTWPSTSRMPSSWSSPATTTLSTWATQTRWWTRSRSS
jgi:pimeloyl-ACP methyl ester carboxylesterase